MVFKSIAMTFYPTTLRNNYNAKVTDLRQSGVSSSAKDARICLFNLDETIDAMVNPIKVILNRINSSGSTIRGYKIISDGKQAAKKTVNASNSITLQNANFRDSKDPNKSKAAIILYGGGNDGQIKYESKTGTAELSNGTTISYTITPHNDNLKTFSYPGTAKGTVYIKGSGSSGVTWEAQKDWYVSWGTKDGSFYTQQNQQANFSIDFPYDYEWESTPTITFYIISFTVGYKVKSQSKVPVSIIVKDMYAGGATGYADGVPVFVRAGEYDYVGENGSDWIIAGEFYADDGGDPYEQCNIAKDNCEEPNYEITEEEGYIEVE